MKALIHLMTSPVVVEVVVVMTLIHVMTSQVAVAAAVGLLHSLMSWVEAVVEAALLIVLMS